jgi:hypothetical protein
MKNIRTLLIAASALAFMNISHAQTSAAPAASASAGVAASAASTDANAPYSKDPLVQKRQADSVAKAQYKERKKAAKQEMKEEKKDAKADMKADKAEATEIRNNAMATQPAAK